MSAALEQHIDPHGADAVSRCVIRDCPAHDRRDRTALDTAAALDGVPLVFGLTVAPDRAAAGRSR
jgi:hypothetical protein